MPVLTPLPIIPENITVHLGEPGSNAENVTVPFPIYIKNVASSELFPTWPENALRANIYAQITFALNRIYNEHYRSRGYDYDITSSPDYDQTYIDGREIYSNISLIVDQIFNNYIVKGNQVQPYFTQYCSGTTVTCEGLSQWGSVNLANLGYTPYRILQTYYGNDIGIVENAPIKENVESYPGIPLSLGISDETVRTIQRQLNRISDNYPAIPKIPIGIGVYDEATRAAVSTFQDVFDLPVNGTVDKATWYKIKRTYNAVVGAEELYSEGIISSDIEELFRRSYQLGDADAFVSEVQFYLRFISNFDNKIQPIDITGVYDQPTADAVAAFQKEYGLPGEGVLNRETWNKMQQVYISYYNALPKDIPSQYFSGYYVTTGTAPQVVKQLQGYLNVIARNDKSVPPVDVTGIYDDKTKQAVKTIQEQEGILKSGYVGPLTWTAIVNRYNKYKVKILDKLNADIKPNVNM